MTAVGSSEQKPDAGSRNRAPVLTGEEDSFTYIYIYTYMHTYIYIHVYIQDIGEEESFASDYIFIHMLCI